ATAHWPQRPTPAETATAVADVACKQQVNLTNTWLTVEAAYQTALIGQDLPTLSHLQDSFQRLFKRAQALLSGQFVPTGALAGVTEGGGPGPGGVHRPWLTASWAASRAAHSSRWVAAKAPGGGGCGKRRALRSR